MNDSVTSGNLVNLGTRTAPLVVEHRTGPDRWKGAAEMSIARRREEITGYYRIPTSIWDDPAFTSLTPGAQLAYFYARCQDGRSAFGFTTFREGCSHADPSAFHDASSELAASPYGRVLDGRGRRDIPLPVRREVLERDRVCQHCGVDDDLSLDHVIPYSQGGPDTAENLQVLCRPCNSRKGARV